ncbi:MAG: transposase [Phycisphaerales bacterium]
MEQAAPIRKRMKRWEIPGNIRFITFSCQRRLPLLTNPAICRLFVEAMTDTRRRLGVEIFAWVIMPEHVHMLMRPAGAATLDRALLAIKLSVAQRVIARWRELQAPILERTRQPDGAPRFWQKGGGFDRNVRDTAALCRDIS